jgi:hypothetical protein
MRKWGGNGVTPAAFYSVSRKRFLWRRQPKLALWGNAKKAEKCASLSNKKLGDFSPSFLLFNLQIISD